MSCDEHLNGKRPGFDRPAPEPKDPAEVRQAIMAEVDRVGDPTMADIKKAVNAPEAQVVDLVGELVREGALRQKECSIEHDWTYRRNSFYQGGGES